MAAVAVVAGLSLPGALPALQRQAWQAVDRAAVPLARLPQVMTRQV